MRALLHAFLSSVLICVGDPLDNLVYMWPLVVTLRRREELFLLPTQPLTYRPWRLLASHVPSQHTHVLGALFFPTMTLGMTATQRVERIFSAMKNGRNLKRKSTFRQVRQRVEEVAEDLALASRM